MPSQFKPVSLFGAAIVAEIPSTFEDVSEIRQVPDNQEVYLDKEGFSSIVFDILERVETPSSDIEALKFHLSDIVGEEDAKDVRVWNVGDARLQHLPDVHALTLLATSPPGEKMRGRANEPDFVGILLLLVRLEKQKTDFVVAVNVPHMPGSYEAGEVDPEKGKLGTLLETGRLVREKILSTLEIRDWGLFVEE